MRKNTRILLSFMLVCSLLLSACGAQAVSGTENDEPEYNIEAIPHEYTLVISEAMSKNRATLRDSDGDFSDWVELSNYGAEPVSLAGMSIGDKSGASGWQLPDIELQAGEYLLIFASGKDRYGDELHADFSLSEGESVYLKNPYGENISSLECISELADYSVVSGENGAELSAYPTPGSENSMDAYIARQESLEAHSPLIISEACAHSTKFFYDIGYVDWFEVRNVSSESILLSDYYASDDIKSPKLMQLPEQTLAPGEVKLIICKESFFELSSESDRLYLSTADGELADYIPLTDIPYGGSVGREDGRNGYFYYENSTPGDPNYGGSRYVSSAPVCVSGDGVFDDVALVNVELSAAGQIYYTTDGTLPTRDSKEYTGPITLTRTTPIRAISIEDGACASRVASFNFIINEYHTLPVVSLNLDDIDEFNMIWQNGMKTSEITGNLSFYEEDGSFSINCGMKLNGETSLILPKKNMSLRFRGAYGDATLKYDLYGGGAMEFQNILLRAGQDYYNTVFRNELCQELCLDFSDNVISQRSRFVVLYMNGEYYGVYTIKEKTNEAMYAFMTGTDKENATALEANIWANTDLFENVLGYCMYHDMSDPDNYAYVCEHLNIDSLIDWLIAEGICANNDLTSGNLRYVASTELGNQWVLMHYDLDATFANPELIFTNVISEGRSYQQVTSLSRYLLKNPDFRDRFLTRCGEALGGVFSNESILAKIDELADEIRPELPRDFAIHGRDMHRWEGNVERLKNDIINYDWAQYATNALKNLLKLTPEEMEHYFG